MKKHFGWEAVYWTDDEVISAVEDFSTIMMRASIPRESKQCNTDGRSVRDRRGDYVEKETTLNFGQIQPLHHHSQPMNFSAHPRRHYIEEKS